VEETAGFLGQAGQGESRKMAGPALADAAAALVLADLLDRKHAETLYGPWFNVIGGPPLPAPMEEAEARSGGTAAESAKASKGAKPVVSQLKGAAKPNVLKTTKPNVPKKR
jgi:hypothetical protein